MGWRLRGRGDRLEDQLGDLTGVGVQRVRSLEEGNPMLGTRGVRLGLSHPEMYEMQVRAIFRATVTVRERTGRAPHLEIMIPTWPTPATVVPRRGGRAEWGMFPRSGGRICPSGLASMALAVPAARPFAPPMSAAPQSSGPASTT